jgi:mRNA-degrading endonuclease toxin of MazEF toxin-antitoxin module
MMPRQGAIALIVINLARGRGQYHHRLPEVLSRRANRPLRELTVINAASCAERDNWYSRRLRWH